MKNQYIKPSIFTALLFSLLVLALASCQEVIDVDLKSKDAAIVIQGQVTNTPGPHYVKINRTVNFNETNTFPPVTSATVIITDNNGITETLTETSPGTYSTSTLTGIPGRTYTLSVTADGKEYIATSTMLLPAAIKGLQVRKSDYSNNKIVDVIFKDSLDVKNFYRMIEFVNGKMVDEELNIFDDEQRDGQEITYPLYGTRLMKGDSVAVLLQTIDKGTHEFYRTSGQASGQSESPANPNSNISNGALGYFGASSVSSKSIIVEY